jgi:hypothetical protein
MSSLKCPECGLVNFATAPECKRCKVSFGAEAAYASDLPPSGPGFYQPGQQEHSNLNYAKNAWRDGKLLVMTKETMLPHRCVKCNEPAAKLLRRTVEWYPRYVVLVFIFIRIIGLILYFCLRKRVTVYVGLCETHLNRRRIGALLGTIMLFGGLFVVGASTASENYSVALGGLILFLAGIITMVTSWRTVTASKIEEPYVWVKGVHRDFLDQLPAA